MCMVGDDDSQVSRSEIRKARKPHTCGECDRTIEPGEKYVNAAWLYDGSWSNDCMCWHCRESAQWLYHNCGGYVWNAVYDDIDEHVSEYPELAFGLTRLKVGIRRKWRFRSGKMMPLPRIPATIASVIQ